MSRRVILLTVAVVVAALGAGLVFLYVQGADDRAEARFDTVDVLIAAAPIEAGETIEDAQAAGKLRTEAVPESELLANYQTDTSALAGLLATTRIYPGEQIISDKFGGAGESEAVPSALPIPKDKIAISVNLTDPARVAGFVNPGSEVAIFHSTPVYSRLLLAKVTVLGVGSTTPAASTTDAETGEVVAEQLPRTLLTIAVSQKEAEKVQLAAKQPDGEVSFALLTDGSDVNSSPGTTLDGMFR